MWKQVLDNLSFIGVCLAIFAGLVLIAYAAEKLLIKRVNRYPAAKKTAYTAMFAALAGLLMLVEIPLFFAPAFYKIDLSELPVLICSFALGPVSGVICELLKVVIKLLIKGTSSAFVGDFANFVVGCTFVLPASIIYHTKPGNARAITGLAIGTAVMTVFGSLFNALYLIPKFAQLFHMELDAIVSMGTAVNSSITSVWTLVLYAVVPFNLVKGVVVSVLSFLLYKALYKPLGFDKSPKPVK